MKLFSSRAADYLRSASADDRRYLLYNPIVKMKVTLEGEKVINLLWDVIAARGFEKDVYFEMAAREIRALPKLEGTAHVNMALVVKFMKNYFFTPGAFPDIPKRRDHANDDFLFNQGPAGGLGKVRFHDYAVAYANVDSPNAGIFREQIDMLKSFLVSATPDESQARDIDFLLSLGELFTLVVYGQLIIEETLLTGADPDILDQIFDVMIRDFSAFALQLYSKPGATDAQTALCLKMIRKPAADPRRFDKMWNDCIYALKDAYEMNP
jgi:acyl-CoA dehydrogenase